MSTISKNRINKLLESYKPVKDEIKKPSAEERLNQWELRKLQGNEIYLSWSVWVDLAKAILEANKPLIEPRCIACDSNRLGALYKDKQGEYKTCLSCGEGKAWAGSFQPKNFASIIKDMTLVELMDDIGFMKNRGV